MADDKVAEMIDEKQYTARPAVDLSQGAKADSAKMPMHLIPWDAIESVAKTYKFGADKYAERNWEKGIAYSRLFGALIRHSTAWFQKGEEFDEEGNSHLDAMVFNALALRALTLRGVGPDDRPVTSARRLAEELNRQSAGYGMHWKLPGKDYSSVASPADLLKYRV